MLTNVRTFCLFLRPSRSITCHNTLHHPMSSRSETMIEIDGSQGEGGGQILRNAIAYAAILDKKIRIHNIRGKRSKPGLKAQHVASLKLPAKLAGGILTGDDLHSSTITYQPSSEKGREQKVKARSVEGIIDTAGSVCLLLQASLPCALYGNQTVEMKLQGGTNATMAPQYDYWYEVLWPILRDKFQLLPDQIEAKVDMRGYYPKGGGQVRVTVKPLSKPLPPLNMTDCGVVNRISIRSFCAGSLPKHLAAEMGQAARKFLTDRLGTSVSDFQMSAVKEPKAVGSAMGILIVAKTTAGCILAGSALCEKKERAQDAGERAAQELWSSMLDGGCVDEWLQDQLIIFMALATGESQLLTGSLTLHTQTAIWIAQELTGAKFQVLRIDEEEESSTRSSDAGVARTSYGTDGRVPGRHLIICQGIGHTN